MTHAEQQLGAEAITAIAKLAKKAAGAALIDLGPYRKILAQDGECQFIDAPYIPPPACHALESLASLADFIERRTREDGPECKPAVFYDSQQVAFLFDLDDRRERAVLELDHSPLFCRLTALEADEAAGRFDQKRLLRFLRFDLHEGLLSTSAIDAVRQLNIKRAQEYRGKVELGKESLGHSVEAAVDNAESIPQEITVRAVVFPALAGPTTCDVRLAVDLDLDAALFTLKPYPGELDAAIEQSVVAVGQALRELLADETDKVGELCCPIYRGRP